MLQLLKEITVLETTRLFFLLQEMNLSLVDMFVLCLACAKMKAHRVTLSSIPYGK